MYQDFPHPLRFSYLGKFSPIASSLPDLNIPKIDQLEGFFDNL
jgi:hypothetical protein